MGDTHGFGHGVTGAQLRALIGARGLCPGCAGTRRQWSLRARSSVACAVCADGGAASGVAGAIRMMPPIEVRPRWVAAGEPAAA